MMVVVDRSKFLEELQAQFGVERAVVVDVANRATGRAVGDVQRVIRGDENEVYRIQLVDGSVVYARIARPSAGISKLEVWAMERARSVGVPVPDVLSVEVIDVGEGEQLVTVIAEARGRQLDGLLSSLSADQRHSVMNEVGRVLARVHGVSMPGLWRPDASGAWPDPAETLRRFIADRTAERETMIAAGLAADETDRVIELIGASPHLPAPADPVLCHGDVSPEHVFVDDGLRVSALIDWGLWHGASAMEDLADAAIRNDPRDLAAIVDGHGIGSLDDPRFRRELAVAVINLSIGLLAWQVSVGDQAGLASTVAVMRRYLPEVADAQS